MQGLYFCLISALLSSLFSSRAALDAYFDVLKVTDASETTRGVVSASHGAVRRPAAVRRRGAFAGFKGLGETRAALQIPAFTVLLNIVLNGPFIRKLAWRARRTPPRSPP